MASAGAHVITFVVPQFSHMSTGSINGIVDVDESNVITLSEI